MRNIEKIISFVYIWIDKLLFFLVKKNKQYSDLVSNINTLLLSVFLYLLMSLLIALPLLGLNSIINAVYHINLLLVRNNNIKNVLSSQNLSPFLLICIVGPFIEEILFRLWLSFKKIDISLSLSLFIFYLVNTFVNHNSLYNIQINKSFYFAIVFTLLMFFLLVKQIDSRQLIFIKDKYLNLSIFISCLFFGLIHIKNFIPLHLNILWAYPFFVLPQLLFSFMLSYLRLNKGFIWSLLLHSTVNLVTLIL